MNNDKLLVDEIRNLKVSLSKNADSFDFLKRYLIDKGVIDESDFEFGLETHMTNIYSLSGDLIIEEYNLTTGEYNLTTGDNN